MGFIKWLNCYKPKSPYSVSVQSKRIATIFFSVSGWVLLSSFLVPTVIDLDTTLDRCIKNGRARWDVNFEDDGDIPFLNKKKVSNSEQVYILGTKQALFYVGPFFAATQAKNIFPLITLFLLKTN